MIFAATQLDDAWLINLELREDEQGFFARSWCRQELAAQGLDTEIAQESLSSNRHCGTVRGLHFHHDARSSCTPQAVWRAFYGPFSPGLPPGYFETLGRNGNHKGINRRLSQCEIHRRLVACWF